MTPATWIPSRAPPWNSEGMGTCSICGRSSPFISSLLGFCSRCIRERFDEASERLHALHRAVRLRDGLPPEIPRDPRGKTCRICANRCRIPEGERGYCGVYENRSGRIMPISGDWRRAYVHWYYDPLPTNCCAAWVCPGCSPSGYPRYSSTKGPEYGYSNLAVFYCACNFDCLFCQNWTYRQEMDRGALRDVEELVMAVREGVSCVCFFGGDPTPQVVHALLASRGMLSRSKGRILRICWETNGQVSRPLLLQMAKVSLSSGGCIKVDLKCYTEQMSLALCGADNRAQRENFRVLAELHSQRPDPPFLVASTLLVPGYVDEEEIRGLAEFIASLDPAIPWTLLAFHPDFHLRDLPTTPRDYALRCLRIAKEVGLRNVHLGNVHLLS